MNQSIFSKTITKIKSNRFLFEELVKRDFMKKYKRTVLGILWSVLAPLLTLAVMAIIFSNFFGRSTEHFVIYLFCGNMIFTYFRESTMTGMTSLLDNAEIFSKVNVPKYMFLLSKNVVAFITFAIEFCILLIFAVCDGLAITPLYFTLIYPIVMVTIFNVGMGLILSALYLMFKDTLYLYEVLTMLLMYLSAIFYNVNEYPEQFRWLFNLNPVYVYIFYFREVIISAVVPTFEIHLLIALYSLAAAIIGAVIYKKQNYKFLYYI